MVTRLSRILALAIGLGLCRQASAWPEILFLRDGRLLFGTIVGTSGGKIACEIAGQSQSLDIGSILRSETDLSAIADTRVEVLLLDSSVLGGRIAGYDDEGLTLETSFGTQRLAPSLIASIVDPQLRSAYSGPRFLVRAGGGAYAPVLSGASAFGPSWTASAGADWALSLAHGLYAGFDLAYSGADYLAGGLSYAFASVRPVLSYRFDAARGGGKLLEGLRPLVSLSAGPAYIGLSGAPTVPSSYGNPTAAFGLAAGLEAELGSGLIARLEGRADAYLQKAAPFVTMGGLLSISYGR